MTEIKKKSSFRKLSLEFKFYNGFRFNKLNDAIVVIGNEIVENFEPH